MVRRWLDTARVNTAWKLGELNEHGELTLLSHQMEPAGKREST